MIIEDLAEGSFQDSLDLSEDEWLVGEGTRNQYYIIAGSFTEPENARQVALQYKSQGYQTSIVTRTNSFGTTLYMVSLKTFNDLEEAESYKKEIQSQVLPSAWLFQKK